MFPVIYSDEFLLHDTGHFHPENSGRLTAIQKALRSTFPTQIRWQLPTPVEARSPMAYVQAVHSQQYLDQVRITANRGGGFVDGETVISPRSYEVALLAVNAWLDGVDLALSGQSCFVMARPPGHHAIADLGMGFCLLSNAAIAAHYALENCDRVAILDWDVHHGNGTQAIVEKNPRIRFCSLHESPQYPRTGDASEKGFHQNVLNLPVSAGSTIEDYEPLFQQKVMPFLSEFEPDLLIISAGYDANAADPLAGVSLKPEDYKVFTKYCLSLTRKIVFGLEGGYDYDALARSVVATIEPCLEA
ncbi:MAG: histone deacetylase [Leptolyngbya sp. Prado105]|jgi:acetoin utilization deacetylase AcuC-like enzyme|nr:histone deacetylase [Leptolyngbya sp. Prado105]